MIESLIDVVKALIHAIKSLTDVIKALIHAIELLVDMVESLIHVKQVLVHVVYTLIDVIHTYNQEVKFFAVCHNLTLLCGLFLRQLQVPSV